MPTTRLAPSPTGALHLGNARTFLVNWLLARQQGWRIVLRIEDLDGPRIKKGADQQAIEDLRWLGLDWDDGPVWQSSRMPRYRHAIQRLTDARLAYPCVCTRRDVEQAASAPHAQDGADIYPGTCRGRFDSVQQARAHAGREPAMRLAMPDEVVRFDDGLAGTQSFNLQRDLGDFVISKADGTPAYQLAVVLDDADMGVTHVVRGDDLLESTARQIMLYRALDLPDRIPHYLHLSLVIGPDGKRLAKRHGDTRLSAYRNAGASPARLRALLARWCGMPDAPDQVGVPWLLDRFDLSRLSRNPVIMSPADHDWLMNPNR
jgi:glutamyl-tRNA synthetase